MKIIRSMITDTFVFHERSTSDIIKLSNILFKLINEGGNRYLLLLRLQFDVPYFQKKRSISYHRRNAFTIDDTKASSSKHSNNKSAISGPASTNIFTVLPFKKVNCVFSFHRNNTPSGQKV